MPRISPAGPREASPGGQHGCASSRAQPQSRLWPEQEPECQQEEAQSAGHSGDGDTGVPGQHPVEGSHPPRPEDAGGDTGTVRAAEDEQAPKAAAEQVGGQRGLPRSGRVSWAWRCPSTVKGRGLCWNHVPGVRGAPSNPVATPRGLLWAEAPGWAQPPAGLPASCPLKLCVPVIHAAGLGTVLGWHGGRRCGTRALTAPGVATQGRHLRDLRLRSWCTWNVAPETARPATPGPARAGRALSRVAEQCPQGRPCCGLSGRPSLRSWPTPRHLDGLRFIRVSMRGHGCKQLSQALRPALLGTAPEAGPLAAWWPCIRPEGPALSPRPRGTPRRSAPGPAGVRGVRRAPCRSPVFEAVPACHLRRAPSSPRRPVPRASPCRSWCPGWPGPSRTTSCGPCATPASAPCTPTASTQVTCRGSLLSPCGLGGRRHPHHGPGSPGGVCSGPGHEGFGDSGEQRLTMRASQQATLPAPFSLGDVVLKQVKFGWGP